MTTLELSRPAAEPTDTVGLVVDEKTLRKNLRFAFANFYTVVQELLQNARRAGATQIDVEYNREDKRLVVSDDGCGLKDFSILLRYAASGWTDDVASAELPFGMGFLAAVYAAKEVLVVSGQRQLRFDSAALLEGASFPVTAADHPVQGTRLELLGVSLQDADTVLESIARGYAVPINYNGRKLTRSHAADFDGRSFHPTTVGLISIPPTNPTSETYVYLQGLLVYQDGTYWRNEARATVVHLDASKWRGKFPDRDRCIDEAIMVSAVKQAIHCLCEERLADLKASLAPAEFCVQAYDLARSLCRLEVFNDVDVAPASWFGTIASLPYSTLNGDTCFDDAGPEGDVFTREQFESGQLLATAFEDSVFPAWYEGYTEPETTPQFAWMLAYKLGAKVLTTELDDGHWLHGLMKFSDGNEIAVVVVGATRVSEVPDDRTHRIGGVRVQLCEKTVLRLGDLSVDVDEPWVGEADGETTLFVPAGCFVDEYVLRQYDDYSYEDSLQDDDLDEDVREVNQFLRELVAESPKERLQLSLRAALRDYRNSLKDVGLFAASVDEHGLVTVTDLVPQPPAALTASAAP